MKIISKISLAVLLFLAFAGCAASSVDSGSGSAGQPVIAVPVPPAEGATQDDSQFDELGQYGNDNDNPAAKPKDIWHSIIHSNFYSGYLAVMFKDDIPHP